MGEPGAISEPNVINMTDGRKLIRPSTPSVITPSLAWLPLALSLSRFYCVIFFKTETLCRPRNQPSPCLAFCPGHGQSDRIFSSDVINNRRHFLQRLSQPEIETSFPHPWGRWRKQREERAGGGIMGLVCVNSLIVTCWVCMDNERVRNEKVLLMKWWESFSSFLSKKCEALSPVCSLSLSLSSL